jgi:thiol-disulfide isomerase/thioredoxin
MAEARSEDAESLIRLLVPQLLSPKPFRPAAALLIAAALIAAACDSRTTPPEAAGPQDGTDESVVVQLLRTPTDVPAFTVTDLDGRTVSSTEWKGKVVIVNFWATWCAPCLAEIPDLIALQNKYRDHLVVVGVSEDEISPDIVQRFAQDKQINYPIVMATPELQKLFPGVIALPTTFVLDPDGRMAHKRVGLLNAKQTEGVTRVLAGLDVNARIERVDDPSRLSAEGVSQITDIPGVDLARVPTDRRSEVIQALNDQNCTCGCGLSVAKCRIDDPSCDVSLPVAKTIVAKYVSAP